MRKHDGSMQARVRIRPRRVRYVAIGFVVVTSAVVVSCGADEKPSASQQIVMALQATTSGGGLEVAITVEAPDDSFRAVEHIDLKTARSSLSVDDGEVTVAPGAKGLVFFDSASVREETGGRWLMLSSDEVKELSTTLRAQYGDLAGLMLRGGLTLNWLTALSEPGNTTLIGREVVDGQATSHFLAEPLVDAVSSPVEAWVSDDGFIVQIRYLTANDADEAVDVTASIRIDDSAGTRDFPTAEAAVTRAQLDEEAQIEMDRVAAAEAAEKDRLAAIDAAAAEAADNPVSAGEVTVDDVGVALNRLVSAGANTEYVFGLPELEQICVGISDVLAEGTTLWVECERRLSAPLREVLCPVVVRFESAMSTPLSRIEIAAVTTEMAAVLDGKSELGLVSRWASETPDSAASESPLEATGSEIVDLPIRETLKFLEADWNESEGVGVWLSEQNAHDTIGATCDIGLPVNWDVLQNEPPPRPITPAAPAPAAPVDDSSDETAMDRLAAAVPLSIGATGPAVVDAQRFLQQSGIWVGRSGADGGFGPDTAKAVALISPGFGSMERGDPGADGVLTTEALERLREALRSAGPTVNGTSPCVTMEQLADAAAVVAVDVFRLIDARCSSGWATAYMNEYSFGDSTWLFFHLDPHGAVVVGTAYAENGCALYDVPADAWSYFGCQSN